MTVPARAEIEMGQLGLALIMEDFRRRIERSEMTEEALADLLNGALNRFPPEFETELRGYLATHSPANS